MWESVLLVLAGGAIPTFNSWLKRRDDRKKLELERKDKYKLVAVEKRLEAHQQAIIEWDIITKYLFDETDEKYKAIARARNFWLSNCLYLEKNTRNEFDIIIRSVDNYVRDLNAYYEINEKVKREGSWKNIERNWDRIYAFPEIVLRDVELEPIAFKPITDAKGKKLEES